jgi:vacuolar-type H+-ATPase subunit H
MFDKLKKLADQAKEKATPLAGQAAQKAAELAAEAKEKAGPLAEQAKERATELAAKAAPAVSQGVDKAAGSLDKATGGRFTDKLDKVQGVVHETATKVADKGTGDKSGDPTAHTASAAAADGPGLAVPADSAAAPAAPSAPAAPAAPPPPAAEGGADHPQGSGDQP